LGGGPYGRIGGLNPFPDTGKVFVTVTGL
jgi:hypothetical protein